MGNCNFCSQQAWSNHMHEIVSNRENNIEDYEQSDNYINMINQNTSLSMDAEPLSFRSDKKENVKGLENTSLTDIRIQPVEQDFEDFEFDDRLYSIDVFKIFNFLRTNPVDHVNDLFKEKLINVKQMSYCDRVIDEALYKNGKENGSVAAPDTKQNSIFVESSSGVVMKKVVWSNKLYFLLSDYLHEADRGKKFDVNYIEEKIKEQFGVECRVYLSTLRNERKIPPMNSFNSILREKIENKNFNEFLTGDISFGAVSSIFFKDRYYDTILSLITI